MNAHEIKYLRETQCFHAAREATKAAAREGRVEQYNEPRHGVVHLKVDGVDVGEYVVLTAGWDYADLKLIPDPREVYGGWRRMDDSLRHSL